jgi:hypothetical protein
MKRIPSFLSLLFLCANLYASNIITTLDTTRVDTSNILIGDRVIFNVLIEHQKNDTVNFLRKEVKPNKFEIISFKKNIIEKDSTAVSNFRFVTAFFETGKQAIPCLPFQLKRNEKKSIIYSDSLVVNVKSVISDKKPKLKDVKSPLTLHLSFIDYLLPILVIAAIILTVFLLSRMKSKKPILPAKKKKCYPAHIIALNKLEKLKSKDLLKRGKIKKYFVEISWICREYLENRYILPILEMTTTEIRRTLKKHNIEQSSEFSTNFIRILTECDKVKFAKFVPPISDGEKIMDDLVDLIYETKLVEEPATDLHLSSAAPILSGRRVDG